MQTSRNTPQRQMVMQAVQALHHHPTAEDIYAHVAKQHPHISRATVYRNLSLLAGQGQVQRVSPPNAADRFDFELKPHYHFLCQGCGGVFDVDMPYSSELLAGARPKEGFVVTGYELTFSGLCPTCAAVADQPENPSQHKKGLK